MVAGASKLTKAYQTPECHVADAQESDCTR